MNGPHFARLLLPWNWSRPILKFHTFGTYVTDKPKYMPSQWRSDTEACVWNNIKLATPSPTEHQTKVAFPTLLFQTRFEDTKSLFIILHITKNPFVLLTIALLLRGPKKERTENRVWTKKEVMSTILKTSLRILETFKNRRMLMRLRYPLSDDGYFWKWEKKEQQIVPLKNEKKWKKSPIICKGKRQGEKNNKPCVLSCLSDEQKKYLSNLDEQVCY